MSEATGRSGGGGASQPEPVLNLLHRGYKSVVTDSTSLTSHKRQYNGDCELVKLNWKQFFNIAKAKLHDVTRGVTIPAEEAMLMRMAAAGAEAAQVGKIIPVRTEAELNARYGFVVGTGVADVVNACMKQKQPTWKEVSFHVQGSPCEGSGRPDFLIKQTGAGGVHGEVDVCGGEGEMPSVVYQPILHLTDMQGGVGDMLMQACSYCQEKGWRFTFVTTHLLTFIIWRVAEDKYAVTNGILYDADPYDLFAREALAYIIWMSLEAPWCTKLPAGQLQELEAKLKGQAAVAVLHGRPKERQGQGRTGKRSASTWWALVQARKRLLS
ncbi:hypothetical protein V8C86DRAFT_2580644 [Haematococcus lacustris]